MITFASFLDQHVRRLEPLSRDVNLAYWQASLSGEPSDFERFAELQVQLQRLYSSRQWFERIRAWKEDPSIDDPLHKRQLHLLYNAFLRNQIDPELNERITKLATRIEHQFNVHRARIDGTTVTSNDILCILKRSDDEEERRKAWQASKSVAPVVRQDLINLVKLRNEAAAALGYSNYYAMSLELNEQSEVDILALFDELDARTEAPFSELKDEVDDRLAERFGIEPRAIKPWHYEDPFFQEAPRVYDVDLDRYYDSVDIVKAVTRFYADIGLDVSDIITRSDLYERAGKDQHAFCTDIDRRGDIRILANIKSNENWAGTLLHELGHAVHDKYIDPGLPFLLRQEAHIFTTEAVAMLFGRMSKNPEWIEVVLGTELEDKENTSAQLQASQRLHQLVFARWSQVMMRFERQLYENPDRDLDALWWELCTRYQRLQPPAESDFPHWAAKTHIVSAPVYYHNYLLGEILASQLVHTIRHRVIRCGNAPCRFDGHPELGAYLRERVFTPGKTHRWDALVERATGEPLTPAYFVNEFLH